MAEAEWKTRFWEPWVPAVGQRVRLVKRAECVCLTCGQDAHSPRTGPRTGTVRAVRGLETLGTGSQCGHPNNPGHRFLVEVDGRRNPTGWPGWGCAAIELEPLEEVANAT